MEIGFKSCMLFYSVEITIIYLPSDAASHAENHLFIVLTVSSKAYRLNMIVAAVEYKVPHKTTFICQSLLSASS